MARVAPHFPFIAMAASCFEEKPDLLEDARGGWILRRGHVILSLQRYKAVAAPIPVRCEQEAVGDPRLVDHDWLSVRVHPRTAPGSPLEL
jgi:hypothetical protein